MANTEYPLCYLYAKDNKSKHFKAFDAYSCRYVDKLIYATVLRPTPDNTEMLINVAEENKDIHLVLQLRLNNKIYFTTT